jgi:A/G-specific adenine glycosylase
LRKQDYFREVLLQWFEKNRRSFPWREEGIGYYKTIISEILLQRTKAETVAKYYAFFFEKYPHWDALMGATLVELEDMMKPLGLHRQRATRLYTLAQGMKKRLATREYTPKIKPAELQEAGFSGLYLRNAYELFILNKRKPLLDVNMSRLLKRYFSPGEYVDVRHDKAIQSMANQIVQTKDCKTLNWAILDYAATVCTAKAPACNNCQLNVACTEFSRKKGYNPRKKWIITAIYEQ